MTCRELIDFLGDYYADELPADQRAEFERHLAACKHCRWYLESYRAAIFLGRSVFRQNQTDVPANMPEELVQAILSARAA
jgi:anti-sigma factor RsiW